jgi:hypothetical protein
MPESRVPADLDRPIDVVESSDGGCTATPGRHFATTEFGGIALGVGPLRPLVSPGRSATEAAKNGTLVFRRAPEHQRWYQLKTLWFSSPAYQGPAWIRGRRLGGRGRIRFGESPELEDPLLSAGPTVNGTNGYREWPGATWITRAGCYMWQVDGTSFSHTIVFRAKLG